MNYDWDGLAGAIRSERGRRRWSQADLADKSGLSISTVKNLEGQHDYKRPPIAPLQAVDRAFGWPVGTLEAKLDGAVDEVSESELESRYRRDEPTDGGLTVMIHDMVYEAFGAVAPGTTLAEFRRAEAIAIEVAARHGFGPPRRRKEADGGLAEDSEPEK